MRSDSGRAAQQSAVVSALALVTNNRRSLMKRIISVLIASAAVGLVVWGTTATKNITSLPVVHADAPKGCSTETAAGNWGFTLTGTAIFPTPNGPVPVPVAAVGRIAADDDGSLIGTEARSVGGGYADETATGNWTVHPDCTGTLQVNLYESGQLVRTSVTSIVFDDNSKEFRMVQKSLALPNGTEVPVIITLEGRKQ